MAREVARAFQTSCRAFSKEHSSCALFDVDMQRQYHRLVEMLILLHLDPADTLAAKTYRLQVKERLYRFNYVRACDFRHCQPLLNVLAGCISPVGG